MNFDPQFDPDNPEWTEADFAAARGPEALPPELLAAFPNTKARGGRPGGSDKQSVSIRLDKDVVEKFKAGGPGWQTRINAALRRARA
ncbi:MAG TPA: BrnA antitoxin family protein [Allosphingosinicella sp.]